MFQVFSKLPSLLNPPDVPGFSLSCGWACASILFLRLVYLGWLFNDSGDLA